ncbi:MAG TPA: hypothetical protein VGO07_01310 [Candidatus Saccharimonadales bacterium]|nr:hypothetical protein [Candidatus Saccharimonadales bacterium]
MASAEVMRWQLFGKQGDPLPPGLLKVSEPDGRGFRVVFDPALIGDRKNFFAAIGLFVSAGLLPMLQQRADRYTSEPDAIKQWVDAQQLTPYGSVALSFADPNPSAPQEGPLPYPIFASRAGTLEAAARQDHAAGAYSPSKDSKNDGKENKGEMPKTGAPETVTDTFETNFAARQVVTRGLWRLAQETTRQPSSALGTEDAITRARNHYAGVLREGLAARGIAVAGTPVLTRGGLEVTTADGASLVLDDDEVMDAVYRTAGPLEMRSRTLERRVARLVCVLFLKGEESVAIHHNYPTYEQLIIGPTAAIAKGGWDSPERVMDYMVRDEIIENNAGLRTLDVFRDPEFYAFMRQPAGDVVPHNMLPERTVGDVSASLAEFHVYVAGKEDYQRIMSQRIGESYADPSSEYYGSRLMQMMPTRQALPEHNADALYFVQFDESTKDTPAIGGFNTVSRSRNADGSVTFGFAPAAEDPYTSCTELLPEAGRSKLAQLYRDLWLPELAKWVEDTPDATVEQLEAKLLAAGVYEVPEQSTLLSGKSEILKLRRFIEDNKVYGTCDLFAQVLKTSINTAFGPGHAQKVSAYNVRMTGGTVGPSHSKVAVFIGGRQYMLDTTPGYGGSRPPSIVKAPLIELPDITATVVEGAAEHTAQLAEQHEAQRAESAEQELIDQLLILFDVPARDALLNRVARLPEHDPSRMTLKALLQVGDRSPAALESIDAAIRLITGIMQSTNRRVLSELGVDKYSTRMLNCMWMALDEVRATILGPAQDNEAETYKPRHAVNTAGTQYRSRHAVLED